MKWKKEDEIKWSFYLLAGLLFLRIFMGIRLPILAVIIFAVAGIVFLRNSTKDPKGLVTMLLGIGMLVVAYQIATGSSYSLYSAASSSALVEEAMTSTPLTDFFLNIWNSVIAGWAFFMSYMKGKI